jgi:medium-chain acyl-[acyl-carrier-protein] hydrolase
MYHSFRKHPENGAQMYQYPSRVTWSMTGPGETMTLHGLVTLMQDCSIFWLDTEPVLRRFLDKEHVAMLVASRQVDIDRLPRFGENVIATTSIYGYRHCLGYRNTKVESDSGELLAVSWMLGAFVNLDSGKLTEVPDDVLSTLTIDPKIDMQYRKTKIPIPKVEPETSAPVTALASDIDLYLHVNNAQFIRIADEYLPEGFSGKHLRVEYKAQVRKGEVLVPKRYDTRAENGCVVIELDKESGETATVVEWS